MSPVDSDLEAIALCVGIALVLGGIASAVWLKKRKFDRTNEAGIERFPSFSASVFSRTFDALLWFASATCLFSGVIVVAWINIDSWGWIVIVPAFLWLLLAGVW
jgi:hypothetical protein